MNSMPWMWEGEGCIFFFLTFAFLFSATPAAHGSFQVRASTEAARATPSGQPLDAQEQSRQEPCPRGGGGQEHLLGTTAYTKTGKEGRFPVSIGQSLRRKVSLRPDASSQPCCSPAPRLEPPSDCPRGHLLTRK